MDARLATVCRQQRQASDRSLMDIANRAGVSQTTIHKFEAGRGWRRETNRIVAAYAKETGTTERELWQAALDR